VQAARRSGIDIKAHLLRLYILSAGCAGMAPNDLLRTSARAGGQFCCRSGRGSAAAAADTPVARGEKTAKIPMDGRE